MRLSWINEHEKWNVFCIIVGAIARLYAYPNYYKGTPSLSVLDALSD